MKPQDIVIAAKVLALRRVPWTQNGLARELHLSPSEVNGCLKRLTTARLFHKDRPGYKPRPSAITEFVVHGLKYVYPVVLGEPTRGVATAFAAGEMAYQFSHSDEIPVWPHPEGNDRGYALAPLHKCVPQAAVDDPELHTLLALIDVFRLGRVREVRKAEEYWSQLVEQI